ncbi:MAG TPA: hypothetical protein VIQ97_05825 [Prevotella sp.]
MFADDRDENPRRWAVDAQIGGNMLVKSHTEGVGISSSMAGVPSGNTGLFTKLHAEFYLPNTPFSVKGGYEHEEINAMGGDVSADFDELMLGGRYYPLYKTVPIQPYVGVDALWNLNGGKDEMLSMNAHFGDGSLDYTRTGMLRQPRLSFAPVVGADLYVLSCVAFQVEYGFRMAVNSSMDVTSSYVSGRRSYHTTGRLHRHTLTVGIKATFPFSFSRRDGVNLIDYILGTD